DQAPGIAFGLWEPGHRFSFGSDRMNSNPLRVEAISFELPQATVSTRSCSNVGMLRRVGAVADTPGLAGGPERRNSSTSIYLQIAAGLTGERPALLRAGARVSSTVKARTTMRISMRGSPSGRRHTLSQVIMPTRAPKHTA